LPGTGAPLPNYVTMRQSQTLRAAVLISAGVAALSLAACNQNGSGQNGAYVAASSAAPAPLSSQPLPPANTYQRIANIPPPPLPVYDQPPIPGPGYLWTPGYWDWSDDADDYYWVPGTWVEPPEPGYLWTPGYWRF
jgi:WXXGXW repeat (2 copies)